MLSRRELLQALGLSGLAAWIPLRDLVGLGSTVEAAGGDSSGELYGGFVLLPDGAPVPATVKYPAAGIPIVCGVGGQTPMARSKSFDSHAELKKAANLTLFDVGQLPPHAFAAEGEVVEYIWGGIYSATLVFRSSAIVSVPANLPGNPPIVTQPETYATITAFTEFPRPYPVWTEGASSLADTVTPQKVGFLPSVGLQIVAKRGHNYYWIVKDLLYQLSLERPSSEGEAQAVASSLTAM